MSGVLPAIGEFQSYIRTGGEWIPRESEPGESSSYYSGQMGPNRTIYRGTYVGGLREPGRFTSKLAPASSCSLAMALARDRESVTVPPAPRYDTPREVTARAHERGTPGASLPVKGEELGVKFVRALRALGPGWERPMLTNVEMPWGKASWRVRQPIAAPKVRRARKAA